MSIFLPEIGFVQLSKSSGNPRADPPITSLIPVSNRVVDWCENWSVSATGKSWTADKFYMNSHSIRCLDWSSLVGNVKKEQACTCIRKFEASVRTSKAESCK